MEHAENELWGRFNDLMAQLVESDDPYEVASTAYGDLLDPTIDSELAGGLYSLWADLTDRYELSPEFRAETEELMRRAASEWLAAKDGQASRNRYLAEWRRALASLAEAQGPPFLCPQRGPRGEELSLQTPDQALAYARQLAEQIALGEIRGDVPVQNAAVLLGDLLRAVLHARGDVAVEGGQPEAIEEFRSARERWPVTGQAANEEIRAAAHRLLSAGMGRPTTSGWDEKQ